jgi:hypothetical protein
MDKCLSETLKKIQYVIQCWVSPSSNPNKSIPDTRVQKLYRHIPLCVSMSTKERSEQI